MHEPAPISSRQLTWHPAERRYTGEISSTFGFGRVYPDGRAEGLTVVSARTGRTVVFVVDETHRDADGDITHWHLIAEPRHTAAEMRDLTIVLHND